MIRQQGDMVELAGKRPIKVQLEKIEREPNQASDLKEDEKMSWSELPFDLVKLVSSHLFNVDPGRAITNIRLICKDWSSLMKKIVPIHQLVLPIDALTHQYPYLMWLHGQSCRFFHPIFNHNFTLDFPELSGTFVRFSNHGWLLLSRSDTGHFFFNPFTRKKIDLPPPERSLTTLCFSSAPTSSQCYVIGFDINSIDVIKLGESNWTNYIVANFQITYCQPIICEDKCYLLGLEGQLVVFDINKKSFCTYEKPVSEEHLGLLYKSFLVKDEEELFAVFVPDGRPIIIMGMNLSNSNKAWQEKTNLNNKAIYLSLEASVVKSSEQAALSNKIYFPNLQDGSCIFYSLATGKYHSFLGGYSSEIPCNAKELTNCTWIELISTETTTQQS